MIPAYTHAECDFACPLLNCYEDQDVFYHNEIFNYPCDTITEVISGVSDRPNEADITISPNPVISGSRVQIDLSARLYPVQCTLYDLNGTQVALDKTMLSSGDDYLDIPQLPKGIYVLQVTSSGAKSITRRLIVQWGGGIPKPIFPGVL